MDADCCTARAKVLVILDSGKPLYMCHHHADKHCTAKGIAEYHPLELLNA